MMTRQCLLCISLCISMMVSTVVAHAQTATPQTPANIFVQHNLVSESDRPVGNVLQRDQPVLGFESRQGEHDDLQQPVFFRDDYDLLHGGNDPAGCG